MSDDPSIPQNTAKETLLAIRRHHQDRAALIQNISRSFPLSLRLFWSLFDCFVSLIPDACFAAAGVAESKISRLEKAPSEDAQKRKLQAELKATHKEKIKLDLKYKVWLSVSPCCFFC